MGFLSGITKSLFGGSKTVMPRIDKLTEQEIKAFQQAYPALMDAIQAEMPGQAQLETDIQMSQMPQIAQLMTQLYGNYGVDLAGISDQIDRNTQLAQAQTNLDVLSGPGQEMIKLALANDRQANPEFYSTREATAGNIDKLFNSIDLTGGLSPTEREEISRALAQEGAMRGNGMVPSNLDTVANAMRFGEAGRKRVLENQGVLAQAINTATGFLPASKSGVDTFQVATGNTSRPNAGNALFAGITAPTGNAAGNVAGQAYNSASSKTQAQASPYTKDSIGLFGGLKQIGDAVSSFGGFGGIGAPKV